MQVQSINSNNTSFRSLNSQGINTPKAMALLKKELPELETLAKNREITLSSEYITFGFGDEALLVSVNSAVKKSWSLRKLFNNKELAPISIEGCSSVVDLVNTAIANSHNQQLENATFKMALRDTERQGTIKLYTPDQIARLAENSPSVPKNNN